MTIELNDIAPALYIGHGAPLLLDDPVWRSEIEQVAKSLPKPKGVLMVSAHWEAAPVMLSGTASGTPLIYDFGGFHPKYYEMQYRTPDSKWIADLVKSVLPPTMSVTETPNRGLDHGAWVPAMIMWPDGDVPVLQMSIPTHDPKALFDLGQRIAKLRDHGVMIVGSGFLTHGLPFLKEWSIDATPPGWSVDFDLWAKEALARADFDSLMNFKELAPGLPYAHPTVEHLSPIFVTLGASADNSVAPELLIEGYWMGLAKTSFQVA